MSGITMSNQPGNVNTQSTPVFRDWGFTPSSITINYHQGQDTMPAPVDVVTRFRDVLNTPAMNGRSNPRYRTYMSIIPALPVCVVLSSNDGIYTGPTVYNAITENGLGGTMRYTFQNLNQLAVGVYTFNAYHQIVASNTVGNQVYISEKVVTITIRVFSAAVPEFTPTLLQYHWTLEETVSLAQPFTINNDNWMIKCPPGFAFSALAGVTITALPEGGFEAVGSGPKTFNLIATDDVVPIAVTQNPLTFSLVINGGLISVPIKITFLYESGLFVSTQQLYFEAFKGVADAEPATLDIYYNGNYHLIAPPFFALSPAQGAAATSVQVVPMSAANMNVGIYGGVIWIVNTETQETIGFVQVLYRVVELVNNPYPEFNAAFTLDNTFIDFVSQYDDTYYELILKARIYEFYSNNFKEVSLPFKVALYNRRQKFNISRIIDRLMATMPDLIQEDTVPYRPAEVSVEINERRQVSGMLTASITLENIMFVAGLNPGLVSGCGLLDINQEPARVTRKSIFFLNYLINGYPQVLVTKNGEQIYMYSESPGVKTFKVLFEEHDAQPGDVIQYKVLLGGGQELVKEFRVFPEGYDSNTIIWENEYKLKSAIEFTGKLTLKADFDNRTTMIKERLVDVLKKIENTKVCKLTINTGFILKSDIASVESLVRSKRAVLLLPGQNISLVPSQKTLVTADNDRELISFDIEFDINRKYDEEIYSF